MRKKKLSNASLFETDAEPRLERQRVFVLTNRNNVLEYLSGGLIIPAVGFTKYYEDIGRRSPGRVPIFGSRVFYSKALEETVNSFPVAIELDVSQLSSEAVPSLGENEASSKTPVGLNGISVWAPAGVIPVSAITGIHFRSERDRSEFKAREYSNTPQLKVPLNVELALFDEMEPRVEPILSWLSSLPAPASDLGLQIKLLDRESGGLALLAHAVAGSSNALTAFGHLLLHGVTPSAGAIAHPKRSRRGKKGHGRPAPDEKSGLSTWMMSVLTGSESSHSDVVEAAVFGASIDILRNANFFEAWRPLEQLDAIESRVIASLQDDQVRSEAVRSFDAVRSVIRLDRDFRPLNTGKGLEAAKALLMVLLRPDPTKLLNWDRNESGASDQVLAAAFYLCGTLHGHKRLPISLRFAGVDCVLANRVAGALAVSESVWSISPANTVEVKPSYEGVETENLTLYVNNVSVLSKPRPAMSSAERLKQFDPTRSESAALLIEIASLLGWIDCLESVVAFAADEVVVRQNKKLNSMKVTGIGLAKVTVQLRPAEWARRLHEKGISSSQEPSVVALLARAGISAATSESRMPSES
jgi:hypothetical protein